MDSCYYWYYSNRYNWLNRHVHTFFRGFSPNNGGLVAAYMTGGDYKDGAVSGGITGVFGGAILGGVLLGTFTAVIGGVALGSAIGMLFGIIGGIIGILIKD